jgi:Winged helix DNA-binding domain
MIDVSERWPTWRIPVDLCLGGYPQSRTGKALAVFWRFVVQLDSVELPLQLSTVEINELCQEVDQGQKAAAEQRKARVAAVLLSDSDLIARARNIMSLRKKRSDYFPENYFGDPVWDMVLDLFVARISGAKVSVSSLCIASNVPVTTALRYISTLTEQGAIARRPDPKDGRRVHLQLSDEMFLAMKNYLSDEAAAQI